LLRNAQKRDKKISNQTTEGQKQNKNGRKKATFFVMSPDGIFRKTIFLVFLNSPCYETPKKRVKKVDEKIKIKIRWDTSANAMAGVEGRSLDEMRFVPFQSSLEHADDAASDAIANALETGACDDEMRSQAIAAAMHAGADEEAAASIADKHLRLARAREAWDGQPDLERQRPSATELGAAASKDLLCPITGGVFVDPVMTEDGTTYERVAIERWFAVGNTTSPLTQKEINPSILTVDIAMKRRLAVDIYPFRMRAVVENASTAGNQVDLLDLLGQEALLRLL
jgi:hypothetical protein